LIVPHPRFTVSHAVETSAHCGYPLPIVRRATALILLTALPAFRSFGQEQAKLIEYPSQYYIIHSDLDEATVREAAFRITKNAEEYARRCSAFTGTIPQKLPFFLFRNERDYIAAGGPPGSAGVYTHDTLMAISGRAVGDEVWHVIQHEGFHQFVDAVITGEIPIWANEGMAEYFGEALLTGTSVVAGLIPQHRLQRIRAGLRDNGFRPAQDMLNLSHAQWNAEMDARNYDQAWSMVQFLAHAEQDKYQTRFQSFLHDVGLKRLEGSDAWQQNFGASIDEFEEAWRQYWLNLPDHPTRSLYAEAYAETLAGFLGRAVAQKQAFDSFEGFKKAAEDGKLACADEDWLPPSLLIATLPRLAETGRWELLGKGKSIEGVVCIQPGGAKTTARFTLRGKRIGPVTVKTTGSR